MSAAAPVKPGTGWNAPWMFWGIVVVTVAEFGMLVWMLLPGHFHGWRFPALFFVLCGTQCLNLARLASERRRRLLVERS